MSTAKARTPARRVNGAEVVENVIVNGDLSKLTPEERLAYYKARCEAAGLDPLTQPFQYLTLQGKLTLYPTRNATDQLRAARGVSVVALQAQQVGDVYQVTCTVRDREGRTDTATGATSLKGLAGEALINAMLKAESKAKRRATLSLCGLGVAREPEGPRPRGAGIGRSFSALLDRAAERDGLNVFALIGHAYKRARARGWFEGPPGGQADVGLKREAIDACYTEHAEEMEADMADYIGTLKESRAVAALEAPARPTAPEADDDPADPDVPDAAADAEADHGDAYEEPA